MTRLFALGLAATVAMVLGGLSLGRCHGGDAAGCGMSQGFAFLGAMAFLAVLGLLALAFLIPRPWARRIAGGGLALAALLAAAQLAATVEENLRLTGRLSGRDPATDPPSEREMLRRDVRCVLALDLAARRHPEAAGEFREMRAFFAGQASPRGFAGRDLAALAEGERRSLADREEERRALSDCAGRAGMLRDFVQAVTGPPPLD